jgi:hypothetical protein
VFIKEVGFMTRADRWMLIGMYIAASADVIIAAGIWVIILW